MNDQVQLVGISGSLRKDSYNTKLLHAVQELLPEHTTLSIVSFADLPIYNGDLDKPAAPERPEPVRRFREALAEADGFVIVSPEYNYSVPGGLKNAIDWASRGEDSPISYKPVALMGASTGMVGTARMQAAFNPLFQYLRMQPAWKPDVLVANAPDKFDDQGRLTDETAKKLIRQKLEGLRELILKERMAEREKMGA